MEKIESLADLTPGCIMFGPIGGLTGLGVGLGQLALGEAFRVGRLSIRHVGIVVEASQHLPPGTMQNLDTGQWHPGGIAGRDQDWGDSYQEYETGVITKPRLVQAMLGGAEEIEMSDATHWTPRHAYARLPEGYPGQAADAAAIARLMVSEGVAYSPASYLALALWRWGIKTSRLEKWIGRRTYKAYPMPGSDWSRSPGDFVYRGLPCEAICSVLAEQCWTLAGKKVVLNTRPQIVTPGMLASQLWRREGVVWGGAGLL
jgi:hypothetical protein